MDTRPDEEKVRTNRTLVIAVVVVAIIALSTISVAVLYARSSRFNGLAFDLYQTPSGSVRLFVVGNPIQSIAWGDVAISLDGIVWSNFTTKDLSTRPLVTWHYGSSILVGSLPIWLNITDILGDGRVSVGDSINLSPGGAMFDSNTTYALVLIFKPALPSPIIKATHDSLMCWIEFSGLS